MKKLSYNSGKKLPEAKSSKNIRINSNKRRNQINISNNKILSNFQNDNPIQRNINIANKTNPIREEKKEEDKKIEKKEDKEEKIIKKKSILKKKIDNNNNTKKEKNIINTIKKEEKENKSLNEDKKVINEQNIIQKEIKNARKEQNVIQKEIKKNNKIIKKFVKISPNDILNRSHSNYFSSKEIQVGNNDK